MRQEGVITRWEEGRGFGFITPITGEPRVFVHISELPRGARPVAGDVVTFRATRDDRNRLRASAVQYRGSSGRRTGSARGLPGASVVAVNGAYALTDTTLRYQHDKQWEFAASLRNIFDTDAREYVSARLPANLPLPGRSAYAEVRYKF